MLLISLVNMFALFGFIVFINLVAKKIKANRAPRIVIKKPVYKDGRLQIGHVVRRAENQ